MNDTGYVITQLQNFVCYSYRVTASDVIDISVRPSVYLLLQMVYMCKIFDDIDPALCRHTDSSMCIRILLWSTEDGGIIFLRNAGTHIPV